MFNYDLAHWSTFLLAAFLLNISPGPDLVFILSHTVKGGKRNGTAAMLGIWTGAFGHVLFAALGLSAIVAASATAFSIVKWVGVTYLCWLGIKAVFSDGGHLLIDKDSSEDSFSSVFKQGVFIDLLNPKVATFFLAFLPQFVVQGAGPVWAQLLFHGTLIIVTAAFVEPFLIFAGDRMTGKLRESRKLRVWLDRALGGILIALGVRLAAMER
ncbi:LysE family translocator [Maridesulfovibrio bastinii]|jgi:threonine/homoserine/homoserine lactone efflux protein|uniref:LysE family translocator n=1 Tax=Maridesulfovibrio bastinii TaxID=47157 RepID=UPI00041E617E|nr:LysE family translocator [Maridesulfovibrio bastinii]